MAKNIKEKQSFKFLLQKYIEIKGLDIIVMLKNGNSVELLKNRLFENDEIVMFDSFNQETRIHISKIDSIDLFAA